MNTPELNDYKILTMQSSKLKHGGNVYAKAKKLNLLPSEIIDASASLVPFDPQPFGKWFRGNSGRNGHQNPTSQSC